MEHLLVDCGVNPKRKGGGLLSETFLAYTPNDYKDVVAEIKSGKKYVPPGKKASSKPKDI